MFAGQNLREFMDVAIIVACFTIIRTQTTPCCSNFLDFSLKEITFIILTVKGFILGKYFILEFIRVLPSFGLLSTIYCKCHEEKDLGELPNLSK